MSTKPSLLRTLKATLQTKERQEHNQETIERKQIKL